MDKSQLAARLRHEMQVRSQRQNRRTRLEEHGQKLGVLKSLSE